MDNVPVELSQHSIETLTEESEIRENGDSVHDIKANNLSSNVATLLAELQASETNDREEVSIMNTCNYMSTSLWPLIE